jgi:hypothetical protein
MTYPSQAPFPGAGTAAPLPYKRGRRLLLVLVTALVGVTLSHVSLAAAPASRKAHQTSNAPARHAPLQRAKAHPSATPSKSKRPQALHQTQRKTPTHARLAKSKGQAHPGRGKPAKLAAKNSKPAA